MAFNFVPKTGLGDPASTMAITPLTATDWAIIAANNSGPTIVGWTTSTGYSFQQLASVTPIGPFSYPNPSFGDPNHQYDNILATFPTTGSVFVQQSIGNISGGVVPGTYNFPAPSNVQAHNAIFVIINKTGFTQNADPVVTDGVNTYEKAYCTQIQNLPFTFSTGAGLYVARNIQAGPLTVQVVTSDQVNLINVLEMAGIAPPSTGVGKICFGNMLF